MSNSDESNWLQNTKVAFNESDLSPEQRRLRTAAFRARPMRESCMPRHASNSYSLREDAKLWTTARQMIASFTSQDPPPTEYTTDSLFLAYLNEVDIVVRLLYDSLGENAELVGKNTVEQLLPQTTVERLATVAALRAAFDNSQPLKPAEAAIREINQKAEITRAVQRAMAANAAEQSRLKSEFREWVRNEKPDLEQEMMDEYERALFEAQRKTKS